jgi:hypothetical protein
MATIDKPASTGPLLNQVAQFDPDFGCAASHLRPPLIIKLSFHNANITTNFRTAPYARVDIDDSSLLENKQ